MAGRVDASGRGRRGLLLPLALVAAAWWLLAPPLLGGTTTYVVTTDQVSTPDLAPGGLLLVRDRGTHDSGAVVAHRNGPEGTVGLGRIVAARGDRFVVHRDYSPLGAGYRPTEEEILGTAWLYVPYVAGVAASPVTYVTVGFAVVVAAVLLLGGGGPAPGLRPVRRPATPQRF
jgi:hypothetical protein